MKYLTLFLLCATLHASPLVLIGHGVELTGFSYMGCALGADGLADISGNVFLGASNVCTNSIYFQSDQINMTLNGNNIITSVQQSAISIVGNGL